MKVDLDGRRSWCEIDLNQIKQNCSIFCKYANTTDIIAVVKANAYGHGDIEVAKALESIGIDYFAVSNVEEAIRLRRGNVKGEILILGYTPTDSFEALHEYDLTQTLISEKYAEQLSHKTNGKIKCQFAIDTGMNRIGLNACDIDKTVAIVEKYSKIFNLNGIFTHLAVADSASDENLEFTEKQIEIFGAVASKLSHLNLQYVHCLNSAGGLSQIRLPKSVHNVVRLGISLYGLKPSSDVSLPKEIRPALEWKSVVTMVKRVPADSTIGYGRTFKAESEMLVATVSTGYADGYSRALSNKGYVLIKGRKAGILGRICMDQMMIDVSDIPDVKLGDEVVLIGRSGDQVITADDIASSIDTIGYEILCNISNRVSRIYCR